MQTLQIGLASLIIATQVNPIIPIVPTATDKVAVVAPVVTEHKHDTAIEQLIISTSSKYGIHAETALEIARCESGLTQYTDSGEVIRGRVNPLDVGIFQINEKYHLETAEKLGYNIYTAKGNIGYAMWLMKHEGNQHWNSSRPCWKTANNPDNNKSLAKI
ncbi:MAG: transglycosylase SLT domain-containing protein [Candidatus Paceibacterota bacterium]